MPDTNSQNQTGPTGSFATPNALCVLFAILTGVAIIIPKATPIVLIAITAIIVFLLISKKSPLTEWLHLSALSATLFILSAYCLINASWSLDPLEAYEKAGIFSAVLLVVTIFPAAAQTLSPTTRGQISRYVMIGFIASLAYILFEVLNDQLLRKALYNWLPFTRPDSDKHMVIKDGLVVSIESYDINRSVAMVILALWPLALMIANLITGRARAMLVGLLLIGTSALIVYTEHETSIVAALFGATIFAMAYVSGKLSHWVLITVWVVATLFIVPIVITAATAGLDKNENLPRSARARVILWNQTALKIKDAPIFGVGIRTTKALDRKAKAKGLYKRPTEKKARKKYIYPEHTGRHAHNLYLQVWFELGFVGAFLTCLSGLLLLLSINKLPPSLRPFTQASFATVATMVAFSWGIWQSWYMCAIALATLLLMFAITTSKHAEEPSLEGT